MCDCSEMESVHECTQSLLWPGCESPVVWNIHWNNIRDTTDNVCMTLVLVCSEEATAAHCDCVCTSYWLYSTCTHVHISLSLDCKELDRKYALMGIVVPELLHGSWVCIYYVHYNWLV